MTPKARCADSVQGAWWPRSRDLESELPDLLAVLTVRMGSIERVVYDPDGWAPTPRQLAAVGRAVRLDAYRFHAFNTMYVFGSDGARIVLRVIPAATDAESAHSSLMVATGPCRTRLPGAAARTLIGLRCVLIVPAKNEPNAVVLPRLSCRSRTRRADGQTLRRPIAHRREGPRMERSWPNRGLLNRSNES